MFATVSKSPLNEVQKVWYVITFLKLSGPNGIRASLNKAREVQDTPFILTINVNIQFLLCGC